ncbi:MAG: RNA polymerase sigma-70 factor [Flavobacteriaceae bacterium]|nr:RNA polymerase sigma-70 factor [Flavobacteriaceae bacterium]
MSNFEVKSIDYQFIQFKKGNEQGFEFFFKRNYNAIVGFCLQFTGDFDKSKSIAQDSFIKLWLNRDKVKFQNGIKSFLYVAAKTGCLNVLRHKKIVNTYKTNRIYELEHQLKRNVLESIQTDSLVLTELEILINTSIEELPDKCKTVFIKKRVELKKNKEIAEELQISIKAVEANMTRALKNLRLKLSVYLASY